MPVAKTEFTTCRSCSAEVFWVETEKGKRMPVDAEPSDAGNIVIRHDGIAHYLTAEDKLHPKYSGEHRYTSHFATCPQKDQWRKR